MNFKISHETTYLFNGEVFLEPHYLRFRPKKTPFIDLTNFSIVLKSEPEGHRVIEDEENNVIDFYWFEKLTTSLTIAVENTLQTQEYNPFNFIIHPDSFNTIPFTYSEHQHQILNPSLHNVAIAQKLVDYAGSIIKASYFNTIAFVTNLTKQRHKYFVVEYREDGPPLSPDNTSPLLKVLAEICHGCKLTCCVTMALRLDS
ncbi:MAG: hypothetical protein ACJAVV_002869 [Alphaproteobacteria bacterium]|jgi:hypothetical protein